LKKIRVLVTGINSGVGQSIYKSLSISNLKLDIITGDITTLSLGILLKRKFLILPKIEEENSLKKIIRIIVKNRIHVIFIGSEFEVLFYSKYKDIIKKETGALVALSNYHVVKKFLDKYETYKFLKKNNFNYPETIEVKKGIKIKKSFPLILKNKNGTSAKNVFVVNNNKELNTFLSLTKKPILQEYLGIHKNKTIRLDEFTCSFFKTKEKKIIGPFLGKRYLKFGTSWIFETYKNKILKKFINQIAKSYDFEGSINIQLKFHKKKFVPFEINPRFSGTTFIRAYFGFNEPEMYIRNFYLNEQIFFNSIIDGFCMRHIDETFVKKKNISSYLKKN
jgi:carbamoyl-phosphate synthase large subunit